MTPNELALRLWIYVAIAVLSTFLGSLDTLRTAHSWIDYVSVLGSSVLQGFIVARAFIDKSSGQSTLETKL